MAFSGGSGTISDPYQVATAADLALINSYLDKVFIQTADIDLSAYGNWPGIGIFSPDAEFKGNYDGKGFAISGMTATATATQIGGLFGFVVGATIKNVRLRAPEGVFEVDGFNGLFVSIIYDSTVENCRVTKGTITQDKAGVSGAFAGEAWDCVFTDCHAVATVAVASYASVDNPYMGGFIAHAGGEADLCSFLHCSAQVAIENSGGTGLRCGGFVGQLEGSFTVQECWATGSISDIFSSIVSAAGFIGSIINDSEEATGAGLIKDCYTQVNITQERGPDLASTAAFIGQIDSDTGYSYRIDNCYAANLITMPPQE